MVDGDPVEGVVSTVDSCLRFLWLLISDLVLTYYHRLVLFA